MQLADLKTGMVVITRNHNVYYILRDFQHGSTTQNILWNDGDWLFFSRYNDDLTCRVDYDVISMMWNKNPTPSEVQNSRRRARRYAKAHDIMEIHIPVKPTDFFSFDSGATKVLWKRDEVESTECTEKAQTAASSESANDLADGKELRGAKSSRFPEILRMEMPTLSDLRTGLLVTLRNGLLYLVLRDFYDSDFKSSDVLWSPAGCIPLSNYSSDMNYAAASLPFVDGEINSESNEYPAAAADSIVNDNTESGNPYDIADVYLPEFIGDIYKKEPNMGEILWRNEPVSITVRRWIMDVPHCRYSGMTEPLGPEGIKPPWLSDKDWADLIARGLVKESGEASQRSI